jgi:hypothetical protein
MRLDDQRRSGRIEDRRGRGGPRGGGGGLGLPLRGGRLGVGAIIIIGLVMLFFPGSRDLLGGVIGGGGLPGGSAAVSGSTEPAGQGCPAGDQACDFLDAVLGSTEDVWNTKFAAGAVPTYGGAPGAYQLPTLVLYDSQVVETGGCGDVPNAAGPFYCPGDNKLYIDPSFFNVLARQLNSPGDFAQAYVVAHEVGHHVQNLIGATQLRQGQGNEGSVRLELQADCFAGVWAHDANRGGQLAPDDLDEALNAAHNIGDDTLQQQSQGYARPETFTHGTSDQRRRWFLRGFESGDARQCDTFAVRNYRDL